MLPRRSSSSGHNQRRSSILKPPKSRQPFQDLDFNGSSLENSPESTKKRRVSFAEKKHVKEFCDHKEQGTIWDSTYEEPDHTNSKSSELTNENGEDVMMELEYVEKLDTMMRQARYGFGGNQEPVRLETFGIMDQTRPDNSPTKIFFNTSTEIEMTNVITSSRDSANDFASKTILCQGVDLDTTGTVGGIEPTISIDKIRASGPFYDDLKDTENTVVFDSSDGDMKFTQVISSQKISRVLDKTDSKIEDETIIFDDFVMDLTSIESQPESDLVREKNLETKGPGAHGDNAEKEDVGFCNKYADKTVFFNDSSCDMTEAVDTVIRQAPKIKLLEENVAIESQTTENGEEEVNSAYRTSKSGNKTIFFNNVDCEITEAISTLKTRDKNKAEQIVPYRSVEMSREMEIVEPSESQSISLACTPSLQSSVFNESGMEFTTAITRVKTIENEEEKEFTIETDRTTILHDCDVDFTVAVETAPCSPSPKLISEEQNAVLSTGLTSTQFEEESRSKDETRKLNDNTFIADCDKSSDLSVYEKPAVSTLDRYDSDSESKSEGQNDLNENEIEIIINSTKKRKSIDIVENVDNNKSCNSLISINPEHDLVQSFVRDETCHASSDNLSNTFAPNCKRLKVANFSAEEKGLSVVESALPENITSKTIDRSLPETEDLPEVQGELSEGLGTASNCVSRLEEELPEKTEAIPEIPDPNSSEDRESLTLDENEKAETEAEESLEGIEGDVSEVECSALQNSPLLDLNSHSETENTEVPRIYEKRQVSTVEKNIEAESCLDPIKFLDHNDDCCFVMFCEELEKQSKSDNCIWEIRSADREKVMIDFISKSLVVVIHLEAAEELTTPRTIKDIRIISLLGDSANEDFTMIHNILLKKLDPVNLMRQHRTTQDVLPLLEVISQRVKLLTDFMFEFDKLQDLHLINRTGNRISFRLHSYKVQLVIKITINLQPLEEISPNDVTVECVLGTIREKDIKQLITSVKKDHRFLTNYIKDVKEYIAVVVEK